MSAGSHAALPVLLALLLLGAVAGVAAQQTDGSGQGTDDSLGNVTMVVQLQPDGDARWSVSTTLDLSTANETAAFRTLADEFESGEAPTLGLPAFERAAQQAATATGRDMEITAVDRTAAPNATIENGTGRLTLQFTWTAFANVTDNRLVVGDAFETPGGTWLPGLDRGQHLVVRPPEGYGVYDASKPPENGSVRWHGPTTFDSEPLSATFTGGDSDGGGDGSDGGTDGDGETDPGTEDPGPQSIVWLIVVTVLIGGAVAAYVFVRRDDDGAVIPGGETEEPTPENVADSTGTDDDRQTVGSAVDGDADEAGATGQTEDGEETELLSDEERVERLLDRNGGRMKQATIVKETGWSNAKVSQLLSAMDDDGQIDKLRIGRENLISFPDEDVTDLDDE
jgi:hypothetical protein